MRKFIPIFIFILLSTSIETMYAQQFEVMVYTTPDRWHDPTIPTAIDEFREMAKKHDSGFTWAQRDGSGSLTDPFSEDFLRGIDVNRFSSRQGI
ncbi:MAG: hypothetical protein U5K72_19005 [Balneolaceae bacterium]|nr:hypothetical protein [Balneolaceae bacterium]